MEFLKGIKDWMLNSKEKEEFRKAWMETHKDTFTTTGEKYHLGVAYDLYRLSERVKELENKLS